MSYKVFVLEDDPSRQNLFIKELAGHDLTLIDSCSKLDAFKPPYDLIFLDHDLGGRQIEDHEDCGLTFVRKVKDQIKDQVTIVYHSFNPVGVRNMQQELGGRGFIAPFGSKSFQSILNAWKRKLVTQPLVALGPTTTIPGDLTGAEISAKMGTSK